MNSRKVMSHLIFIIGILCLTASQVWAGGIESKPTWSAEFVRTVGNRNAATDSADIAAYNPAGLVKLDDGTYVNASMQLMLTTGENVADGTSYKSRTEPIMPTLFGVYKKDRWAGYLTITYPAGAGEADFKDGNGTTYQAGRQVMLQANNGLAAASVPSAFFYNSISSQSLKGDYYAMGVTAGGAYRISELVALSLGLRYVTAEKNADGEITVHAGNPLLGVNGDISGQIKYNQDATGYTGILGICFFPTDDLTIAARYETITKLEYEIDIKKDNLGILAASGLSDGGKVDRDIPAYLALGASYRITPALRTEASFNYYFNENANWDGAEDQANNGLDAGIMLEYAVNSKLKVSTGYMYTKVAIDPEAVSRESLQLDANSVGGGIQFQLSPSSTVNAGIYHSFYRKVSRQTDVGGLGLVVYEEEFNKDLTDIALGFQYKF
jgi:long-chain fatty acid transport protein